MLFKKATTLREVAFPSFFFLSLRFEFDKPSSISHILNAFYTKFTKKGCENVNTFSPNTSTDVYLTEHINLHSHSINNFHTTISVFKNVPIGKFSSKFISAYDHCVIQLIKHFYSYSQKHFSLYVLQNVVFTVM